MCGLESTKSTSTRIGLIDVPGPDLRRTWGRLAVEAKADADRAIRSVAVAGIYVSWNIARKSWELLVEIPNRWPEANLPKWRGLEFSVQVLPPGEEVYLALTLLEKDLEVPFLRFCEEILNAVGAAGPTMRAEALAGVVSCWDHFFTRAQLGGLSPEGQRGLYAELWWLQRLLDGGADSSAAIGAWKGPDGALFDFERGKAAVEVKSTIGKEPRSVVISNERQLDDTGLDSLSLFVLTLAVREEGQSLTGLIAELRARLHGPPPGLLTSFNGKLMRAGYLDTDAANYASMYQTRTAELFRVRGEFPRIVRLPIGVGSVSYSVRLAACARFAEDIEKHCEEWANG